MTAKIKFSHTYSKIPENPDPSRLLETFVVERSDLHRCFVNYDTLIAQGGGNYSLPKSKLLVLLLLSEGGQLWSTIRRYTPEKCEYYRGMRCKTFKIDVSEVNESLAIYCE